MDLKKAKIEGSMMDVVSIDKLYNNSELYESGDVAVEVINPKNDEVYFLPYRPNYITKDKPGVYKFGNVGSFIVFPEKENTEYQPKDEDIVDFTNINNIQEYMDKQVKARNIEHEILTTPDNIYTPPFKETDTPEMRALKEAITEKHIDIDKYASRFGDNFPNDKRKLKDDSITLFLLKRMCQCLDMKAELTITDVNKEVPNPIGHPIHVSLTVNNNEE